MHLYSVCELKSNLGSVLKQNFFLSPYGGFFHIVCMHTVVGWSVCGWRRGWWCMCVGVKQIMFFLFSTITYIQSA